MKSKISFLIIGFLVFSGTSLKAQGSKDAKEDIIKMNKLYASASSYSMDIEVRMFEDHADVQPKEIYKGLAKRSGSRYFSEMMGRISISNPDHFLMIDENRKLMICADPANGGKRSPMNDVMSDTLYLTGQMYKYDYINADEKCISVKGDDLVYDRIEVIIDVKTGQMKALTYYYKKGAADVPFFKVSILFTNTRINTPISSAEFSSAKYMAVKKGSLVPQGKWAQFRVIDQRKKK